MSAFSSHPPEPRQALVDCTESYFPAFKAATVAMTHAQGGIIGWTAGSAVLLSQLRPETAGQGR
jgi:hypothetical protein